MENNWPLTKKEDGNQYLMITRALAVLSIVSAHCSDVFENASRWSYEGSLFSKSIGAVGVGVFFLISGYVFPFSVNKATGFLAFFKKKVVSILIPWFFCATLVYCYVALRKGGSFSAWFFMICGYMSAFWYMSVLMALFIIYFYFYRNKFFLISTILISMVSSVMIGGGILPQSVFSIYLNPLNWMIYFTFGIYINQWGLLRMISVISKLKYILIFIVLSLFIMMALRGLKHTYFSIYFLPLEILSILALLSGGIVIFQHFTKLKRMLLKLGQRSFSIYLLHMFGFAGGVAWAFNTMDWWWAIPLRSLIVCGAVYFFISLGHWGAKMLRIDGIFSILIGDRS